MPIKKCKMCNTEFETKSNRALYCEECRKKRQIERNQTSWENRKSGKLKPIGSTQICPICNSEYIQRSGSQLCCENCRKKQTNMRKVVNNNIYKKKTYDEVVFYIPKGEKALLKEYAASKNLSLTKLITNAIEEYKKKLGD